MNLTDFPDPFKSFKTFFKALYYIAVRAHITLLGLLALLGDP